MEGIVCVIIPKNRRPAKTIVRAGGAPGVASRPEHGITGAVKTTTDPRVGAYIAKAAPVAQPILRHVRKLVRQACPEAEETIKWSMPACTYRGQILCMFAAFKAHAVFGFWHRGMREALGPDGSKSDQSMGSMGRLTNLDDLPADRVMRGYVAQAMKLIESGVTARPKPKTRQALPVPADLASALKKSAPAAKMFAAFSPSARREYIEWITEAKRPETRQKRIATTIEWLAAGKKRNWQYENC
jgi:uncharacterized protein YdeI (YjbR/CyaY-like superfamily)